MEYMFFRYKFWSKFVQRTKSAWIIPHNAAFEATTESLKVQVVPAPLKSGLRFAGALGNQQQQQRCEHEARSRV